MIKTISTYLTLVLFSISNFGCEEEYNPKLINELGVLGYSIHTKGFYSNPWPTFQIGDSIIFVFSYTGTAKQQVIDVAMGRSRLGTQNEPFEDVLLFDSFYPKTVNYLDTVRWKIDESFGTTPNGFIEEVRINNNFQFHFHIVK
jgi:hypothetical protein